MAGSPNADPFIEAASTALELSVNDMRRCIDGATVEALNWRPAGEETNSIAVLAVHSMHSTRSWLSVAFGSPLPPRDRPSEFLASASGAGALAAFVEEMTDDCRGLLAAPAPADWRAMRRTHTRSTAGAADEVTAAWALVHALQHLREHAGQMQLTRQLHEASR